MHWIALSDKRPPIGDMGQTDLVLVVYPHPKYGLIRTIAFFDQDGKGSGWFKQDFTFLPEPLYWMPMPDVPA